MLKCKIFKTANASTKFSSTCLRNARQSEFLIDLIRILIPTYMVRDSGIGKLRMCKKISRKQYLWTWCQSVVPNDFPRDFGPWVAFVSRVSDTFRPKDVGQGGREMSAPRSYVTDPFHPLSSIHRRLQFLYICNGVLVLSSIWYLQVCLGIKQI